MLTTNQTTATRPTATQPTVTAPRTASPTLRRVLAASLVALTALLALAPPSGAHTAMLRASPDRNATAGGGFTAIDLEFLDPITEAVVTVTYNGAPVAGQTTVAEGKIITFVLDQPLVQPGRYQVAYEMVSFDTDFTTGGFFFTFDPAAAAPPRIEEAAGSGGGLTTLVLTGVLAGLTLLAVVLAVMLWRTGGQRRAHLAGADGFPGGPGAGWDHHADGRHDLRFAPDRGVERRPPPPRPAADRPAGSDQRYGYDQAGAGGRSAGRHQIDQRAR
jgi:methionine-rich copper-binding protein CopC